MTREEAKKLAEDMALKSVDGRESEQKGCYNQSYGRGALEDSYVDGYMACYDALTKGEPDGYCAWHPFTQGWTHDESRSLHLYKHIQGAEYDLKDLSSRFERNLDKDRWTIVSVKILEVTEGSSK